jgi:branched-chain amino acid transport system permease protein
MIELIIATGLAVGAVYVVIGLAYNMMYAASRAMSFTSGQFGMLGGVLGSLFILRMGLPVSVGFVLTLGLCAALGIITEIVAVRPTLSKLEQHLYVLSTLAVAQLVQQFTALKWSTEPQPFPRLFHTPAAGAFDEKFWLPVAACAIIAIGLELLYRHTLVGRAFLAVAEDKYAARALGLPEQRLRMASFALAGVMGGMAGFAGGELLLAFFANGQLLSFYGFLPLGLAGVGHNRGVIVAGLALGLFQQAANFIVGGVFASVAVFVVFVVILLWRPQGVFGSYMARRV